MFAKFHNFFYVLYWPASTRLATLSILCEFYPFCALVRLLSHYQVSWPISLAWLTSGHRSNFRPTGVDVDIRLPGLDGNSGHVVRVHHFEKPVL